MATFNQAQRIVTSTYAAGEYVDVTSLSDPRASEDTLFLFLLRELADSESCETLDEAARRVDRAMDDLQHILDALRAAAATSTASVTGDQQ